MASTKLKDRYKPFHGILVPNLFKDEHLNEVINYKPTPDDVFIVTYPKCGTTWVQVVTMYIFRKGQELDNYDDYHKLCPFIDSVGLDGIVNMPRPGALKSHLPFNLLPYTADAKYIFTIRNPKDTCVSLFYHSQPRHESEFPEVTFDEFYELFMTGEVEYGDYFNHLQSWYPRRNDKGIFHTKYEDMKEDLKSVVIRLATFLGEEYVNTIEKDNNVLRNILHYSSFEYMKEKMKNTFGKSAKKMREIDGKDDEPQDSNSRPKKTNRFRKGIVGDWRNHFSEEQSERMNNKFYSIFGGTEIYEKYKQFL